MSAIIDHTVFETKARARHSAAAQSPRAAEFRTALDSYMESYREHGIVEAAKQGFGGRAARSARIRNVVGRVWRRLLGFDAAGAPMDRRAAFIKTPFW